MSCIARPIAPRLLSSFQNVIVTDEMRASALVKTGEVLRKLEELRTSLGLAPDKLELVATIYTDFVGQFAIDAAEQRDRERAKRRRQKALAAAKEHGGFVPPPLRNALGLGLYDELDDDDDDEATNGHPAA
jgi:hypothetical protein